MKFGIIGTNFVSDFFMNGAKESERCEVVAVCSRKRANAERFAAKYEIEHVFDTYQEMAESGTIDAAYVAVPNSLHLEVSSYFLKKGIPVFCEKPLASNIDEVKEMVRLAKENNTYLEEGLIPLYNPNYKKLKESLGMVGKIHQVNLNFSKYSSRYDAYLNHENPTTFQRELSNGATMDLGVYVIGFCVGLFGKPKKIYSCAELLDTGVDVVGSSMFVYDGFVVNLTYSKASDTRNICEICGELGTITIDYPSQPQNIIFYDRKNKTSVTLSEKSKENFYYEIEEMIDRIADGKIESSDLPFKTMEDIHEVLTEVRRQSGIIFPCDRF